MQYTIVKHEGEEYITAFVSGREPLHARSGSHPHYEEIKRRVLAGDESVADLFDPRRAIQARFEKLSDRLAVKGNQVYYDGDPIDNSLTKQVLRFYQEGVEDWKPLVAFFEKVESNPVLHSREQLFKFLDNNAITIAPDGDFVAYKGMRKYTGENGTVYYQPTTHGHVIIDGVDFESSKDEEAKQFVGSVVEMPRSEVRHDPAQHCSVGLHIATHSYARTYGNVVVEVKVNPRDVVSVPNDSREKVRSCRYEIVGEIENPYSTIVREPYVQTAPLSDRDERMEVDEEAEHEARVDTDPRVFDPEYPVGDQESPVEAVQEPSEDDGQGDPQADAPEAAESPQEPSVPEPEAEAAKVVNPTPKEFDTMVGRAKRRRRNLVKYATKHGPWTFLGGDEKNRRNWAK